MALFRHVASGTYPGGEVWSFTLHTQGAPTLTAAETAWVAAINAGWAAGLNARYSTQMSLTGTATASLDVATGKQISRVADVLALAGTAAAEPLPAQCALVVSLRSAFATRSGRGRFYLPAMSTGVMTTGKVGGAAMTAIVAGIKALMDTLVAAGLTPCILNVTTHVTTVVTTFDIGNVIDTQQRRRNKLVEVRTSSPL